VHSPIDCLLVSLEAIRETDQNQERDTEKGKDQDCFEHFFFDDEWSVMEIPCRINKGVVLTHSSSTNKIEK
jgi:hypothetical protein